MDPILELLSECEAEMIVRGPQTKAEIEAERARDAEIRKQEKAEKSKTHAFLFNEYNREGIINALKTKNDLSSEDAIKLMKLMIAKRFIFVENKDLYIMRNVTNEEFRKLCKK